METPAPKSSWPSQETKSALTDLARLLGKQAAKELIEAKQADPINPLYKDEGARDD